MQLASSLEGGPMMWMRPLHLYVNQKSDYDDDSPFVKASHKLFETLILIHKADIIIVTDLDLKVNC